jgi:very-short-patch-repair endonuclease
MRFKNQEIFEDTDNVLHKISSQLSLLCGAERGAEGGVR